MQGWQRTTPLWNGWPITTVLMRRGMVPRDATSVNVNVDYASRNALVEWDAPGGSGYGTLSLRVLNEQVAHNAPPLC